MKKDDFPKKYGHISFKMLAMSNLLYILDFSKTMCYNK